MHRHRYEANPAYRKALEKGHDRIGESNTLIEAVEVGHLWFLGCSFTPSSHPEQNPTHPYWHSQRHL
ncbi:hypothetical protein NNO_0050 [Hydrogenimonas sp.]|nr:hypothetical protein NNO_0050 [Hydrogenimonas sp.]